MIKNSKNMIRKLPLGFLLLFSLSAQAGVSAKLMQLAARHPGHFELETHGFIKNLKTGSFRREQIAQFFQDRIYLSKIMEKALPFFDRPELSDSSAYAGSPKHLTPQGHCNPPQHSPLSGQARPPEERVFFRSLAYEEELNLLIGNWVEIEPSPAAIQYGEYLQGQSAEVVSLHLWLFLVGETFGAQHISDYIHAKFSYTGNASKRFEDLKLMNVRRIFNLWISDQLEVRDPLESPNQLGSNDQLNERNIDLENEIGLAYSYLLGTFDAAEGTPNVHFCQSALTLLSERFFILFGH